MKLSGAPPRSASLFTWVVFILVIIGALGVGLMEATGFDLVGIFGGATSVVNYLIGLAALWMLFTWWSKVGK